MTHNFLLSMGKWVLVLAVVLTACAPMQATSPATTASPTQETLPSEFTSPMPLTLTATPAPALPSTRAIEANQGWQSVYQFVHPGDELEITATGAWSHDPADPSYSGPYGSAGVDSFDAKALLASAPVGSLVGRIGDSAPFVIGEHVVMTSAYRGELWISMNDAPDRFSDNTGYMELAVRLTPKAVPPGIRITNSSDGYRLVYPADYYLVITENGLCLTPSSVDADPCNNTRVAYLEVTQADGRTAEQIAKMTVPATDLNNQIMSSFSLLVDGADAFQIDGVIAGNSGLMVTVVHGDRAYIWRFVPWEQPPGMHDVFLQMQTLYDTVINSFQLLD